MNIDQLLLTETTKFNGTFMVRRFLRERNDSSLGVDYAIFIAADCKYVRISLGGLRDLRKAKPSKSARSLRQGFGGGHV
jgi:hypothetical protein